MALKGILGRKLGMTQVFDAENRIVPVTVIEAGPCHVTQLRTPERDGYRAVQLSFGDTKAHRLSKAELGHLKGADAPPQKYLVELRVESLDGFEIGQTLKADVFDAGEKVDVTGISKGHGFSGAMKRHNFSGQGASYGNHKKHRAPGAIGACATPARVFKGTRMAGQMGGTRHDAQPRSRRGRRRARHLAHQGFGARPQRWPRVRPQRDEGGCEMTTITMKTATGGDGTSVELPDDIFGIEPNLAVLHQVVTASSRPSGPVRTARRHTPRSTVAARSRGARRAPAAPARARSARRSGGAVVWRTAPTRATTRSARPRR